MALWPPAPTLVLSTRSSRFLPSAAHSAAAHQTGLSGIDLDQGMRLAPFGPRAGAASLAALVEGQVDSIWLPVLPAGRLAESYMDALSDRWATDLSRLGVRTVIIDRDMALRPAGSRDRRPVLSRLRDLVPTGTGIVLALRPQALEGNRQHLNALVTLRRTAEEWDFSIGIDLLGSIDGRWEAEAAIQRILPRLSLVRLPSIAETRPDLPGARVTSRVLAYLLDQGYQGTLSLTARMRPLDLLHPAPQRRQDALTSRAGSEAAAVMARYQRLYGAALPISPDVLRAGTRMGDRG